MSVESESVAPNEKNSQLYSADIVQQLNVLSPCDGPTNIDSIPKSRTSIPCKGLGKRGKPLNCIESNYLPINIDQIVDRVYRYTVIIQIDGPPKLRTKVFAKFCSDYLREQANTIVYDDDSKTAISPSDLNIDKRRAFRREFQFVCSNEENEWRPSRRARTIQSNKRWSCKVTLKPFERLWFPIKQALTG